MRLAVYYDLASGGAAFALQRFVEYLRGKHTVHVFHPPGAWPVVADGVALSGIGPLPRSRFYYWNRVSHPRYFRRLEQRERETAATLKTYDRILVHSCRGRGAPAMLEYLDGRGVFYVTEPLRLYREPRFPDGPAPLVWGLSRWMYAPIAARLNRDDARYGRQAQHVLANSRYTARRTQDVYGRTGDVVYPSVNPDFLEGPLGSGEGTYILSPGAIIPPKGHGRVVRAVARLAEPRPPLVIAGSPVNRGYARRLESLALSLGVSLEVRTDVNPEAYRACVAAASVVVVGAVREPLGLVSLEAQALGRPVVAVGEGGLPETLAPEMGGFVCPPDPDALSAGIHRALESAPPDGSRLRAWVREHFAPEICGSRLEEQLCT